MNYVDIFFIYYFLNKVFKKYTLKLIELKGVFI